MAEEIRIAENISKKEKYRLLNTQLKSLVEGEPDSIANISNIVAGLKHGMNLFWVGVYFAKGDELVLGPFQGTVACTRIKKGKGVCGYCWEKAQTVIVDNVDEFPGHIACSSLSKSEIVVPVFVTNEIVMLLDVDSDKLNDFDEDDRMGLEETARLLASVYR